MAEVTLAAPGPAVIDSAAPTVLRTLLGTRLRRLRESRGISAAAAARAIRASESKISRIELGRNTVREVDVADLLTLYGVSDAAQRGELLSLASRASQQGWWHSHADALPAWFEPYLGLEESATSIRSFDTQFVPGLLQTPEYAQAVIQLSGYPRADTDRMVSLRRERQRRVAARGVTLHAVIDETVLRCPKGQPGVLRNQLAHLLAQAGRPGLTLQVAPFGTAASCAVPGSFSILRLAVPELPDVVYVEQLASAIYLDKAADVSQYVKAMDQINASSTTPEQTTELIRSVLAEMEGSGDQ